MLPLEAQCASLPSSTLAEKPNLCLERGIVPLNSRRIGSAVVTFGTFLASFFNAKAPRRKAAKEEDSASLADCGGDRLNDCGELEKENSVYRSPHGGGGHPIPPLRLCAVAALR